MRDRPRSSGEVVASGVPSSCRVRGPVRAAVDLDIRRVGIESQPREETQSLGEVTRLRMDQHEVDIGDMDVVGPNVDLFHHPRTPSLVMS
jgi:hypothetical protein